MNDIECMEMQLYREPYDIVLRSVLADAHEEAGNVDVARCLRWMVENQKWPRSTFDPKWYDEAGQSVEQLMIDHHCDLPHELFILMDGGTLQNTPGLSTKRVYRSVERAERDIRKAFAKWKQQ